MVQGCGSTVMVLWHMATALTMRLQYRLGYCYEDTLMLMQIAMLAAYHEDAVIHAQ
jgi:hypothetical protein